MQQAGDSKILVASGFQDQSRYAHQVTDIWDSGLLARLRAVLFRGKKKGIGEAVR
jgi:hypothetical protein